MKKSIFQKEVFKFVTDNKEKIPEIKKFYDDVLLKIQMEIYSNPKIFMTSHKNGTGKTYVYGKTELPITFTKVKYLRVYVGVLDDFPKGRLDKLAKNIATKKMKEKLMKHINKY